MTRLIILLAIASLACSMTVLPTAPQSPAGVEIQAEKPPQIVSVAIIPLYGIVTVDVLEVRECASEMCHNIGYLKMGSMVILTGYLGEGSSPDCLSGWLQTTGGYVCKDFVK